MPRGGSKPGERRGGRQKGTPNKATLEKQALAARSIARDAGRPIEERERGSDALFRLAKLCESAAAVSRPTTADDLSNNPQAPQNPDGNWPRFFDFVRLAAWCYKAGAEFREPKMLGVAIAPPPPTIDERDEPEIIRLRVFEGDRQVKLIERKPRDVA